MTPRAHEECSHGIEGPDCDTHGYGRSAADASAGAARGCGCKIAFDFVDGRYEPFIDDFNCDNARLRARVEELEKLLNASFEPMGEWKALRAKLAAAEVEIARLKETLMLPTQQCPRCG